MAGDLAPRGSPDGKLDAADLLILEEFITGALTPVGNEALIGDVAPLNSPDGHLNAGDLVVLSQAVNGLVTLPPVVTGPAAPVLDAVGSPTGNNPQTVTGTAIPDTEVRLYVDGVRQDSVVSDAAGQFSFQAILSDGTNSLYATVWDGAAESSPSNVQSVDYVNSIPRNQGGTITQDTVWTPGPTDDPYVINSNLVIANGASLILMPGTQVRFAANYALQVDGELIALGTASAPVIFTSGHTYPAPDDWQGIYVSSTATRVVIDHAEIHYADRGVEFAANTLSDGGACDTFCVRNSVLAQNLYGLYLTGASPWIERNLVQYNVYDGLYLTGASPGIDSNTIWYNGSSYAGVRVGNASNPVLTGNVITGQGYGVSVYPATRSAATNATPVVHGNALYGNSSYDFYAYNFFDAPNVVLDATGNWWGTTSAVLIATKVYDNLDSATYAPVVDFGGYLDGFQGSVVTTQTLVGTIGTDTTLTGGATYEVLGSLHVPVGVTLTIPAGVTLRFDGGASSLLQVDGALAVQGTAGSPVVFTSGQGLPAPDDWQGIYVSSTATRVVIDYAEIHYADRGVEFAANTLSDGGACDTFCVRNSVLAQNRYGLYLTGASPWIERNLVQYNVYDGLYLTSASPGIDSNTIWYNGSSYAGVRVGTTSDPVLTGNVITGQGYGVYVSGNNNAATNPAPVVHGNGLYGNSSFDFYARSFFDAPNVVLDATGNWWGTTSAALIATKVYDNLDSATNAPVVDFGGYLDGFQGSAVTTQTLVGTIGTDTTLTGGVTYEVLGNLHVPAGVTLTIPAGVTLRFDGGASSLLQVDGALAVQGTAGSPVVFTSGQGLPAPDDWQGIYVSSTATRVVIDHAEIHYANRGVEFAANTLSDGGACDTFCVRNSVLAQNRYGLYLTGASPWIEGNTIQSNTYDGIWLATSAPTVTDNTIQNNGVSYAGVRVGNASNPVLTGNVITGQGYGVSVYPATRSAATNATPVVHGNALYGNSSYDFYAYNFFDAPNVVLDATGNWWGTTSAVLIATKVYDNLDSATYAPVVDFGGYLDGFQGSAVTTQTLVGTIGTDTTLTGGATYEVLGSLHVPVGVTLTIPAGVTLRFDGGASSLLQVDGALAVQGTAGSPVVFTSGQGLPAPDDWQGIYVSSTATRVVIDYAEIHYADRGVEFAANTLSDGGACDTFCVRNSVLAQNRYGLYLTGASPWVEGNTIESNTYDGIWLATSSPTVTDNTIQNNGTGYAGVRVGNASNPVLTGNVITGQGYGVYVYPANRSAANDPVPVIHGNGLYGNAYYDLYAYNYFNAATTTLDATGNWWGTTDPTAIATKVYDNVDNPTYAPMVDFGGYLDGFQGSAVTTQTLAGTIGTDTVLAGGATYEVLSNLTVASGATLTIPAGVTLRFDGGANSLLQVDGALAVQGTAGSPVVFTSGQSSPALNDWQGIVVSPATTRLVIDHAEIRYANRAVEFAANTLTDSGTCDTFCVRNSVLESNRYGLYLNGASPWVEGNTIQSNTYDGIWLATSSPTVTGNTIQNNGTGYAGVRVGNASNPVLTGNVITGQGYGVYVYPANRSAVNDPLPVIHGNGLYGNTYYDLYTYNYFNAATTTLDATGNWWGTTYRSTIQARMYDHYDNATYSPSVDFSGYLDAMNGNPVPVVLLQGDLTADTTLAGGTIYEVLGTLRIVSGVTLTVAPGAVLRFDGATNTLLNEGSLLIQGTEGNPVVITSAQETPAAGDWGGIVVASTAATTVVDYAQVSYANLGVQVNASTLVDNGTCDTLCIRNSYIEHNNTGIYVDSANPWIERNIIQYNLDDGIYLTAAAPEIRANTIRANGNNGADDAGIDIRGISSPLITEGNEIYSNTRYGIYVYGSMTAGGDPAPVITGNGLFDNGTYDLYAANFYDAANVTIDVTGNWWGTSDPAVIATHIYDHTDNANAPVADNSGYTSSPLAGLVILQNVTPSSTTFYPLNGESVAIGFDLTATQASVVLQIYTEKDRQLVYESAPQLMASGTQSISWDGRDGNGAYVPDEAYVFKLTAFYDGRYDESIPTGGGTVRAPTTANDSSYNAFVNDFFKTTITLPVNARVAFSFTPSGGQPVYTMNYEPFEAGTHPIVWDGRDQDGSILSGPVGVWIHDTVDLPSNVIIVKGNRPEITGTAPDIEVKSNPYRIMHSYDQVSRISYNLSADCMVTVKLLPPGDNDVNSSAAIVLTSNELQNAQDGGGQPLDHVLEWRGYDPADTNNILVSEEGTYTFVIQATSVASGIATTYRGALQLYR